MIAVREAGAGDVQAVRDLYLACYGGAYPYDQYYDLEHLTRLAFSDSQVFLVAEETAGGRIVGTASVVLETGAMSDLLAEFGRLAVHPDFQGRGIGGRLMSERLARVRDRLHVGCVEARVSHPYSLRIAEAHGFAPVGLLPLKLQLRDRESVCLLARHFGDALSLRRNHPRVIPEAHALAQLALGHCGLRDDAVADDETPPYPSAGGLTARELTSEGYSPLLRIERGRVRHREIFGPLRLHDGLFRLKVRHSRYLLAMDGDRVRGGLGWTEDALDRSVRLFELIAVEDGVTRFLLERFDGICRAQDTAVIDVDVSAHAPAMQRTLLELGYLPAAYVPAMVFSDVERLDIVRMVRLLVPPEFPPYELSPQAEAIRAVVLEPFARQRLRPRIERAVGDLPMFRGLTAEQVARLAGSCGVAQFAAGDPVIEEGARDARLYILLSGQAEVRRAGVARAVGVVHAGECLGELSVLTGAAHSATAVASAPLETATLAYDELTRLVRARPDIGLTIYRNLAHGLAEKLNRSSRPG